MGGGCGSPPVSPDVCERKEGEGAVERLLKAWNRTEKFLVGLLAFFATIFTFYGVITRYVFNFSPEWIEETVMYMIIWSVFIISSTLVEERGHVGATFVVERFPPKALRMVEVFTGLLALTFCALICYWGYQIVHVAYLTDERSLTSMRYPLWGVYLSVPVGVTLIFGRYVRRIYRLLFRFDPAELLGTHEISRSSQHQEDHLESPPK